MELQRVVMDLVQQIVQIMRLEGALDVLAIVQVVVKTHVIIFVPLHALVIAMASVQRHVAENVHM